MRKLKTADIPVLCRCVKRLGMKDKIREIAQAADTVQDIWSFGFDFVWDLFDIATEKEGEKALYEFLAGPFEMTPKQVSELDLDVLMANIQQLVQENNLAGFFKFAAASMR
jgi:hypothetical protein